MGAILSVFYGRQPLKHPVETYFDKVSKYHIFFFLFIFSCKIPLFWHMLNHLALSPKMDFYCGGEKLANGTYTGKLNSCPCKEEVHWDTNIFTKTSQTKYGLYCEKDWLVGLSKSMVFLGLLFGVMAFGVMADKLGRLTTISVTFLWTGISGCLVPAMPEIISFCFMRCIEGMGTGGATVVAYVFLIEYCGPSNREAISAWFHLPLNISHLCVAIISYILRDCDMVMYAMSVPVLAYALLPLVVMESPKWLVDTGNTAKAAKIMRKICKFNKHPCEDIKVKMDAYLAKRTVGQLTKVSIIQCFKHRKMVVYFVSMAFLYFTCGVGYYGVSQFIAEMKGNPHVNILVSGTVLIPGTLVSVILLKLLNRKPFVAMCLVLASLTMFICIFLPERFVLVRVIIACFGNCLFFMLFIIVFLYGCEIFPTSVRNSMLGLLSLISRIGQISSPLINHIPSKYAKLVYPIISLLSAILLLFAPETKNRPLPSTLEEVLLYEKKLKKKKHKATQT